MRKILFTLAAVLTAGLCFAQGQQRPANPNATLRSVVANPDGTTTFSIYAPQASSVSLGGDLAAVRPVFTKADNGVWSATAKVPTDAYRYTFVVDGVQVVDPRTPGYAGIRPVARVTNGENIFWARRDNVLHGAVSCIYYKSTTTGSTRRMHVWTPAGYEAAGKALPVFYLIHGGGDSDADWPGIGCAGDILDNLLADGKMVPMVVVFPDGGMDTDRFVDELVKDIKPYIEKNYKVRKGAKNTALAGLSMGGLETLNLFLAHPDMFGYINVMSSGWFTNNAEMNEKGAARLKVIAPVLNKTAKILKFTMGGPADIAYANCKNMLTYFDAAGINYSYSEMDGGHSWHVWRYDLAAFAPVLFK